MAHGPGLFCQPLHCLHSNGFLPVPISDYTMFNAEKESIQTWQILVALRQRLGDIRGFCEFTYCPFDHAAKVCDITLDISH